MKYCKKLAKPDHFFGLPCLSIVCLPIACLVFVCLLLAGHATVVLADNMPAAATRMASCPAVKIPVPEGWHGAQPLNDNPDELCLLVVARQDRDLSVSCASGPSHGNDAGNIARQLAPSLNASAPPAEYGGQYNFPTKSGTSEGFCLAAEDDGWFAVTCINWQNAADRSLALPVLKGIQAIRPGLLPR